MSALARGKASARRRIDHLVAAPRTEQTARLWADVRARHPRFTAAVAADARITARFRGDRFEFGSRVDAAVQAIRLAVVSDAFLGLACYRAKAACQARRVPVVPRLLHRLAISTGQIAIGDPVVVEAGVYVAHGQIVIDGMTTIRSGTVLGPFVTIGLRNGDVLGPVVGEKVYVGTGARILGPVTVGGSATIGANAVVVDDVAAGATVAGAPARPTRDGR